MSLSTEIYDYLADQTGLTDIISTNIWKGHLPQNATLPAISYSLVSNSPVYSYDGIENYTRQRWQFDCWSDDVDEADDIAEQLRLIFQSYQGTLTTTVVNSVMLLDTQQLSEAPIDGSDNWVYRNRCDYQFSFYIS